MLDLYKNIKVKRKELHMTQAELAEKMGYADKSMISRIEKGEIDLQQSKIVAFAKIFNITPGDLMGWCKEQNVVDKEKNQQNHTFQLTHKEEKLISDFRSLNDQGQDYILQTMDMVKDKYKKSDMLSSMEDIV